MTHKITATGGSAHLLNTATGGFTLSLLVESPVAVFATSSGDSGWFELAGTTGWMEKVFVGYSVFEGFPSGISSSGFHPSIGRIHLQRD
ncbi:hypothetical protein [Candidimonas nitroreducens]|uniref:hypothetical protein n=1 Tax=Candidimonas nitroreducens TaxID=683354 RepID=UPI001177A698|nr:hypothetical protein [Candidimonas nitroreducens]